METWRKGRKKKTALNHFDYRTNNFYSSKSLELSNLTLDMTAWLGLKDGKVFVKSVATNVTLDSNLVRISQIIKSLKSQMSIATISCLITVLRKWNLQ